MNIVFSILHYIDFDTTKNCIDSILDLESSEEDNIYIVVVDNGSNNDSGSLLNELYKGVKKIIIICNASNEGFAKGNNIGYLYSKKNLNADVVVVINNDIIIEQRNFLSELKAVIEKHQDCAVIAPDVININDEHQNPYRCSRLSILETVSVFFISITYFIFLRIPVINNLFLKIIKFKHNRKRGLNAKCLSELSLEKEGIVPHGSAVIFTAKYILDNDIAFDPRTFLYAEEDLLMERLIKKGYKTLFCGSLKIRHLEDVSTSKVVNTPLSKRLFMSSHKIKSTFILLKERFS